MNPPRLRLPWLPTLGLALAAAFGLVACGSGSEAPAEPPAPVVTPTAPVVPTVVELASGLENPWALAFLPDGRALVTERPGRLRLIGSDGRTVSAPLTGLPAVAASGQGGLLDVAIDPDYPTAPWVYWTYAEPGTGSEAGLAGTAVARGQLAGTALQNVQVIFRQSPKVSGAGHFGARLVFGRDKTLFVALGERQQGSPAQVLGSHLGKVVRIARDGSTPAGNPTFGAGAQPQLWSIGHRNPQGAALHPTTGELWLVEHGPQGGDELNRVLPGRNHGWPLVSYGCNYGDPVGEACRIGGGTHAPTYEEPLTTWVPTSQAPSGLLFYSGSLFPAWQGNVFTGALAGQALWRLTLSGNTVVAREALLTDLGARIRDVRQGPDGAIYLLTDAANGRLLRLQP